MLIIDLKEFSLDKKNIIKSEDGILQYWSQYDFAYKKRVHLYDDKDNEIGYVQYKILSCQNKASLFDKDDNEIDISDLKIINKKSAWQYDIENVAVVNIENDEVLIDIVDESKKDKCLLLIFSLIGEENN